MRTKEKKMLIILSVITVLSLFEFSGPSYAQTSFPTKPISMIVPFAPGGAVDTTIRIISEEAEKLLGQKILVINKPGAGAAVEHGNTSFRMSVFKWLSRLLVARAFPQTTRA